MGSFLLHLILFAKDEENLIDPAWESGLYENFRQKTHDLGFTFIAVNSLPDHVHMLLSIDGTMSIQKLFDELKLDACLWIDTHTQRNQNFEWHDLEISFSFSKQEIKKSLESVHHQKDQHKSIGIYDELEDLISVCP